MRERQHDYELMFIISSLRNSDEDITNTINRVQQAITNAGGEVTTVDHSAPWGRRKLAYPIRKYAEGEASRRPFTEGYYVLLHFSLPTTQVNELERALKLNDAVLRYLITLVEHKGQPVPVAAGAVSAAFSDDDSEDADADEDEDTEE